MKKRIYLLITVVVCIVFIVAFSYEVFLKQPGRTPIKRVEALFQTKDVHDLGRFASNALYTPKDYGFIVHTEQGTFVAVFDPFYGDRNVKYAENHDLVIKPGIKLQPFDQERVRKIQTHYNHIYGVSHVEVLSKHKVNVQSDKQSRAEVFYKVIYQANGKTSLVFTTSDFTWYINAPLSIKGF